MRNKFKKLCKYFVCLAAVFCLMSCLNSVSSSGDSGNENQPDEITHVLFKGSINIENSLKKTLLNSNNSRSASPEAIDMSTHEFYVTATSKAGATLNADVVEDPVTNAITFEMPLDFGEWKIETGIKNSSSGNIILVDVFEIKLLVNTPTFSHAFYLKPVSEGMGSINLEMYVPNSVTKMTIEVHSKPAGAAFNSEPCTADGDAPDRKIVLNRTEVPAGTYNLIFTYYNSADNPLFSTIQTINVLAGLETSKWVNSSTSTLISGGFFAVTDDLIEAWRNQRNHYYVDSSEGSDLNAGGPLDPFKTLSHAVSIINDIYGTETKDVIISMSAGSSETLASQISLGANKSITLKSEGSGAAAKLLRGDFTGSMISIPATAALTLEGVEINGNGTAGAANIGVKNNGTFIMNSGKICGNKNNNSQGGGVFNSGEFELNGGEISGNVCPGSGAGIYLDGTNITISGGVVKNNTVSDANSTPSNLFLPSSKKIKVEKAIASGTDISIRFGWVPKTKTSNTDPAIFTTGYGASNSQAPSTYFKSDERYFLMTLPANTTPATFEAGVALSEGDYVNMLSAFTMTFATNFDKFKQGDTDVANRTVIVTPTIKLNGTDITNNVLTNTENPLKWTLKLYYRGMEVGSSDNSELLIDSGYTGRYDLHVYAEYLGIIKDAEFVITGFNNIISITKKDDLKTALQKITNGETVITRDTCINLVTDVDFSNEEYYPISAKVEDGRIKNVGPDFEGVFDGNGHTIKLGKVVSEDYIGICFRNKGTIQNVILESDGVLPIEISEGTSNHNDATDPTKYTFHAFGGICNHNEGIIRNCWNKISITGASYYGRLGGICGANQGLIENCINTGDLINCAWTSGKGAWAGVYGTAGGITGSNWNNGIIRNCVNYGNIWLNTYYDSEESGVNGLPGAICGIQDTNRNNAKVEYCYWRENCVRNKKESDRTISAEYSPEQNWLVANPANYSKDVIQGGAFNCNGYFPSNTNGTLSNGPDIKGHPQTLAHGTNLVNALNAYADAADPDHTYLKRWKTGSTYAAEFE